MSALVVIPARYASSRYPGKPLVDLRGATGEARSLIRRSWEAASTIAGIDRVVVATDDPRIQEAAEAFGAEAVMTPSTCRNGTERCAAAAAALGSNHEIVVNFQGDAPLTPASFVTKLLDALAAETEHQVATPVLRCSLDALSALLEDRRAGRVGATTAVFDRSGRALYFSKEVLPFIGGDVHREQSVPVFHHVGVYAFRRSALMAYSGWKIGPLERWEGLEQLRFMESGVGVRCVEVESEGRTFWELNNPSDVPRIEAILKAEKLK